MSVTTNLALQKYTDGDDFDAPSINTTLDKLDARFGGTGSYTKAYVVKTDGNVATGGAVADVAGLSVVFVTTTTNTVMEARLHAMYAVLNVAQYTIRFDLDAGAQTYDFTPNNFVNAAGADTTGAGTGQAGCLMVVPGAGTHTLKIRQSGTNATLLANATTPATLVIDYQP